MKRFFILASAAIVALASCAKTEVVYNDAPEQIAFKQITDVMTKSTHTLSSGVLGVFANQGAVEYFDNTPFTWATNAFTAEKYWPYSGTLDFTVYYPYVDGATYGENVLTIPNVTADDAHYYGSQRYIGASKGASAQAVVLKHVSAAIEIVDNLGSLYTLQSVTLNNAPSSGTVTVTYEAEGTDPVVTTNTGFVTTNPTCMGTTVYVLPGRQTSFTVGFKQNAGTGVYRVNVPLAGADLTPNMWVSNNKYTYTLTVSDAGKISFTATVVDFDPVSQGAEVAPEL